MPFSFLNAAFLVGAVAAAVPILIHLFSRRKVARIPFSSIRFLEEIARRRVRRMRLTQWIILALRVLALALLALALGRPAFRGDFAFGKSRGESAVAVILDCSYSMRAEGERRTVWETARERAEEAMAALEADDQVFLVGVDPRDDAVDAYPGRLSVVEALRTLEPGYGTTDLAAAVRRAGIALAEATALNKELFVISDFQRRGLGTGSESDFTNLLAEVEDDVRVFLLPVHEGSLANSALEEARLEGSAVDQRVHLQAVRFAGFPSEEVTVTVESGPEVLGEGMISLLSEGRETAEIPLTRLPGEGEELRARLSHDRLAVDDIRYIPSLGTGRIQAWVVQDPAQQSPFLPLALSPAENTGRIEVNRVTPDALITPELAEIRLLVFDNVNRVNREALMRLRQWKAAGGVIFLSLGDRVDLRYYNESLLPALFPGVALGNLLGTDEATGVSYTLTPRSPGHLAFAGFEAKIGQPLTGASFWRIVEVKNSPGVRTLAEFGPGRPALVRGEGALLFASSLDGRWNNLVTHAAFPPLLHQSLDAALMEGSEDRVVVGESVEGIVDRALVPTGAELVCIGPGGLLLGMSSRVVQRGLQVRSQPAPEPGFYTIQAGARVLVRRAVNLDTKAESDLTPLGDDEILLAFGGDRVQLIPAGASVGTPVREARYGREFWRELVVVVLLLMVSEAWLSRRGVA
jgi:hypothetical protein